MDSWIDEDIPIIKSPHHGSKIRNKFRIKMCLSEFFKDFFTLNFDSSHIGDLKTVL